MKLVALTELAPAAYNPRAVDPERLAMVRLSLQKLGWLLPVFATAGGEILSGHQRTHEATGIGYDRVPVQEVPEMDDNTRRAVNILFNRSTNDMDIDAVPADLKAQMQAANVHALAAKLPDRKDHFPCMAAREEPIAPLVKANAGRWLQYSYVTAKSLAAYGIIMPIIVDDAGLVVNGIGRLQMLAEKKAETALIVRLSAKEAEFARFMLNYLSMDFDLAAKYGDLLRFNSFRRLRRQRAELGRGFVFASIGNGKAKDFDITKPADRDLWIRTHGQSVVDFGAGHLTETNLLRAVGVDCVPFEPYRCGEKEQIDKPESLRVAKEFLKAVASGQQFTSVFISSVLNSVPFEGDRRHIVKICAALCGPATRVYAVASSEKQTQMTGMTKKFLNERNGDYGLMLAGYEKGVILGELSTAPKAQKYHTPEEFYHLFKSAFAKVKVDYDTGVNVSAVAMSPLPLDGLRAALEFEFELPYPDGSRMNLSAQAIRAFTKRLGHEIK